MLGIVLIYFIGKQFYDLAESYDKNNWAYAILGVVSYYGATFIAGILIALYLELFGNTKIEDINELLLSLVSIPFGLLLCWGVYQLLAKKWEKKKNNHDKDILDSDFF